MFKIATHSIFLLLFITTAEVVVSNAQNLTQEEMAILDSNPNTWENPEETGQYFEGDIKDTAVEFKNFLRNGILDPSFRWPNAVVPYEIQGYFSRNELNVIDHAFNEYHKNTCIRFRKRTNERDYIVITNRSVGCWSSVGRMRGRQEVNLQTPNCFYGYGPAIHELMHAVGFHHEQSRYERDEYVKVVTENIIPNQLFNFQKLAYNVASGYGVPYDYGSVMHYPKNAFSKNGRPTLIPLKSTPEAATIGQRNGFSRGDILKINAMYKCY